MINNQYGNLINPMLVDWQYGRFILYNIFKDLYNIENTLNKYTDLSTGVEEYVKKTIITNFYRKLADLLIKQDITDQQISEIFKTINPGNTIPLTIFSNYPEFLLHVVSLAKYYLDTTNNTKCSIIEFLLPGIPIDSSGIKCETVEEVMNFLQDFSQKHLIVEGKIVNLVDWLSELKARNNQIRNAVIKKINNEEKEIKEMQMIKEIKTMEEKQQTIQEKTVGILDEYSPIYLANIRYAMPYLDTVLTICKTQEIVPVYTIRSLLSILPLAYKKSGSNGYGSEKHAAACGRDITALFIFDIIPEIILALFQHYRPGQDQRMKEKINHFRIQMHKTTKAFAQYFEDVFINSQFGIISLTFEWNKEDAKQMRDFFDLLKDIYDVKSCIDLKSGRIKEYLKLKIDFLDIKVTNLEIDLINKLLDRAIESLLTKQEHLLQKFSISYNLLKDLGITEVFDKAIEKLRYLRQDHPDAISSLLLLNNTPLDVLNELILTSKTNEILRQIFEINRINVEKFLSYALILKTEVLEMILKNAHPLDLAFKKNIYQDEIELLLNLVEALPDEKAKLLVDKIDYHYLEYVLCIAPEARVSTIAKILHRVLNKNKDNKVNLKIAALIMKLINGPVFKKMLCDYKAESFFIFIDRIKMLDPKTKNNIQNIILKSGIENEIFNGKISLNSFVHYFNKYQFEDKCFIQKLIRNVVINNCKRKMEFKEFCALIFLVDQLDEDISFKKEIFCRISEYEKDEIKEALEKKDVLKKRAVLAAVVSLVNMKEISEETKDIKKIFSNFLNFIQKQELIIHSNNNIFRILVAVVNYSDLSEQKKKEFIKSLAKMSIYKDLPMTIYRYCNKMKSGDLELKVAETFMESIIYEKEMIIEYALKGEFFYFTSTIKLIKDKVKGNTMINQLMCYLESPLYGEYNVFNLLAKEDQEYSRKLKVLLNEILETVPDAELKIRDCILVETKDLEITKNLALTFNKNANLKEVFFKLLCAESNIKNVDDVNDMSKTIEVTSDMLHLFIAIRKDQKLKDTLEAELQNAWNKSEQLKQFLQKYQNEYYLSMQTLSQWENKQKNQADYSHYNESMQTLSQWENKQKNQGKYTNFTKCMVTVTGIVISLALLLFTQSLSDNQSQNKQ